MVSFEAPIATPHPDAMAMYVRAWDSGRGEVKELVRAFEEAKERQDTLGMIALCAGLAMIGLRRDDLDMAVRWNDRGLAHAWA